MLGFNGWTVGLVKKARETGYERCRGWEGSRLWGQIPLFATSISEYIVLSNRESRQAREMPSAFFMVPPLPSAPGDPHQQDNNSLLIFN